MVQVCGVVIIEAFIDGMEVAESISSAVAASSSSGLVGSVLDINRTPAKTPVCGDGCESVAGRVITDLVKDLILGPWGGE